jgi:Kef-type K+ transport system membrane component KefB
MEHVPSWLLASLIYLAAAVIVVPLSRALGLGAIIGYLAAGLLLARLLYRFSGLAATGPRWRRRGAALLLTLLALLVASGTLLAADPMRETEWLERVHLGLALALPLGLTVLLAIGLLHRHDEP